MLVSWELSVDDEEGGLEEVALLGKLLDWVSSVLKDSLLSVDKTDTGDAVDGVHVSWVETSSDSASWALDLGQISGVDSSIGDGELVRLASSVVGDREGIFLGDHCWSKLVGQLFETVHSL